MGSGIVMGDRVGHSEEPGHILTRWVMLTSLTLDSVSSAVNSGMKAMFPKLPLIQNPCVLWSSCQGSSDQHSQGQRHSPVSWLWMSQSQCLILKSKKEEVKWHLMAASYFDVINKPLKNGNIIGNKRVRLGLKGSVLQIRCTKCWQWSRVVFPSQFLELQCEN